MKNITLLAVGGTGCKIIKSLAGNELAKNLRLLALDSDRETLLNTGLPESARILAAEQWRDGRGCGGNVDDGQLAVARERENIEKLLNGTDLLVVIAGLGRGIGTGAMKVLPRLTKNLRLPTIFFLTKPFAMEGYRARVNAENVLKEDIYPSADMALAVPNDLLFSTLPPDTPLAQAFTFADRELASTVLALTEILISGNLLNANYDDILGLLKRRKTVCSIGIGTCEGAFNTADVVEKALYSPLLGGPSRLLEADAMVISLLSGPELSLASAKSVMDTITERCPQGADLLLAASTSEKWAGKIQLTMLLINFLDKDEQNNATESKKADNTSVKVSRRGKKDEESQPLLPFPPENKGIMEGMSPAIENGEDLDIPVFTRRNISIEKGTVE